MVIHDLIVVLYISMVIHDLIVVLYISMVTHDLIAVVYIEDIYIYMVIHDLIVRDDSSIFMYTCSITHHRGICLYCVGCVHLAIPTIIGHAGVSSSFCYAVKSSRFV